MLLLLLNGFHRHVFPLVPVYLTARERRSAKQVRGGKKQGHKKKVKVGRSAKRRLICGMLSQETNIERVSGKCFYKPHSLYCSFFFFLHKPLHVSKPQCKKNMFVFWFLPFTINDLWSLEWERVWGIRLRLHLVDFSENCIVEVTIGLKVEL